MTAPVDNAMVHQTLALWANFYLITGSAAAALTGLQFIVQTLLSSDELRNVRGSDPEGGVAAFGSPTVVHLSLALIISAAVCVPWTSYAGLQAMLMTIGAGALVYSVVILRRTRAQDMYVPVFEDWLWHIVLPFASYVALLTSALLMARDTTPALFAVAGVTLTIICVGIHNAWDTVTYLTVRAMHAQRGEHSPQPKLQPRSGPHPKRGKKPRR